MKLSDLIYVLIGLALLLLMMACGPEPVRDVPYDYDTDDYAYNRRD
jgi:hypothetical protein